MTKHGATAVRVDTRVAGDDGAALSWQGPVGVDDSTRGMDPATRGGAMPLKVTCVIGTRPEMIKMAPVVRRLKADAERFQVRVVFTAQHRELLDQMAEFFGIRGDADLDAMRPDQTLSGLMARLLVALDRELVAHPTDVLLAQGDTTTVAAAALAAFHRGVRFAHLEAGLRTADRDTPFPEEGNRRFIAPLTDLHFAPTTAARDALLAEGIPEGRILLTGNTVVDTLLETAERELPEPVKLERDRRLVLLTLHRRENFGEGVQGVFGAVRELLERYPDVEVVYPVHPNPNVRRVAETALAGLPRVHLVQPADYPSFVGLMKRASLILSDSGGVQEEAPSLRVPVLVLRERTERGEAVEAGVAELVGTDPARILDAAQRWLGDAGARAKDTWPTNPFGDGHAAERVVEGLASLRRACQVA